MKAHQLQLKIGELSQVDNQKYMEEKEKKMKREIDKLRVKQDNETNNLNSKIQKEHNEFTKLRSQEFDA
jgi:hypothetical protein